MSREIKFKAWDGEKMVIVNDIVLGGDKPIGFWKENSVYKKSEVLMQYTGLKDKNGVEIYESDVIKTIWQHDGLTNFDYEITGVVTWDEGRAQWGLYVDKGSNAGWYPLCSYEREEFFVDQTEHLGNIYQNPELLNPSS